MSDDLEVTDWISLQPVLTLTVQPPAPSGPASSSSTVTIEVPQDLYDKLERLVPETPERLEPWELFVQSPPAIATSGAALVALLAVLATWRVAKRQIRAARDKDWDAAVNGALLDADEALQALYDAVLDISDRRAEGVRKDDVDLRAYRAAHVSTRHAWYKLILHGFQKGRLLTGAYGRVRDAAKEFVQSSDQRRGGPEWELFQERRRFVGAMLIGAMRPPTERWWHKLELRKKSKPKPPRPNDPDIDSVGAEGVRAPVGQ